MEATDRYLSALQHGINTIVDQYNGDPIRETWFVGPHASEGRSGVYKDVCPCLTKTRAGSGGFYVTNRGTTLSTATMLQLQGISPKRMLKPPQASTRNFNMAIGSAMTMPVLCRIMFAELQSVGLLGCKDRDPFVK